MRRFWLVPALLAIALIHAWLDSDAGLRTWWQLRSDLSQAQQRIALERRELERLESEADAIDADPFELERLLREEMRLARPGEVIVRFPPAGVTNPRNP